MPTQRRSFQEVPVCGAPDRLHHIPEVGPLGLEHEIVHDGCEHEQRGIRRSSRIDDPQRNGCFTRIHSHAGSQAGEPARGPRCPFPSQRRLAQRSVTPPPAGDQCSTSRTCGRPLRPARALSSWWLVSISPISPSDRNWIPTTTSNTPSRRSGLPPIAEPPTLSTVR